MQSNCIKEASQACLKSCCVNPPFALPENNRNSPSVDPRREFITAVLSSIQPNTIFTNHESLPSLAESISCLKNAFPQYSNTILADEIRAQEYYHLTPSNHVCLDYTGQGLFSYSQQKGEMTSSSSTVAESSHPSSEIDAPFFDISHTSLNLNSYLLYGTQESEFEAKLRKRIPGYMNVFEDDYSLVFTASQSSSFKILADSYPFVSNKNLLTVYDHENEAVQSMIESAKKKGARALSAVFSWPNLRVNSKKLRKILVNKSKPKNRGLFVFPLQSKMTGTRYSYQWMNLARENGWHVLLDACALGPKDMETLGLSFFQPDFLICSFYKIFGVNPSGFCCLFIKKSIVSSLSKSSTSMGIISLVPSKSPLQKLPTETIHQTPSTPTPNSAQIGDKIPESQSSDPARIKQKQPLFSEIIEIHKTNEITEIEHSEFHTISHPEIEFRGLDHADKLGLILISTRTRYLINWLVNALLSLKHPNSQNGLALIAIYGPKIKLDRGPALAFNVYDWKGERVDPILVQKLADRNNISVSCGVLKNLFFPENFREEKEKLLRNGKGDCGIGVVSISIGMLTDFEDVYRIWVFVSRFLDADFVEKERWRYTALNQTTVEV